MPGIVVGVDGSGNSRRALDWAMNEAAIRHTPLTVLTVYQPIRGHWSATVEYPWDAGLTADTRKTAQEEADTALERLSGQARPPEVTALAVIGLPAVEILRVSADADMIVVGSRGAGGFATLLMGSVSSQVAQHARCPVVVVPGRGRSDADIRREITQDLIADTYLCDPARFTVTVKDGVVTIEGTPDTTAAGRDMIEAVRHIEGVAEVRDRLTYPPAANHTGNPLY